MLGFPTPQELVASVQCGGRGRRQGGWGAHWTKFKVHNTLSYVSFQNSRNIFDNKIQDKLQIAAREFVK